MKHLTQPRNNLLSDSINKSLVRMLLIPTAFMLAAPAAMAQEKATNLDRITVTGSNIPRATTETASPVQVMVIGVRCASRRRARV